MAWTVPPKTTLRDYFESHFYPHELAPQTWKTRVSYDTAVDRFTAYYRGDIPLTDINEQKLAAFEDWLVIERHAKESTVHTYAKRIRRIVRTASGGAVFPNQNGQASPPTEPAPRVEPKQLGDRSIRDFLESVYIRERSLVPDSQRQLRIAVLNLNRWAGREIRFYELPELMNDWIAFMQGSLSPSTVKKYRADILSVWRYAADIEEAPEPKPRRVRKPRVPKPIPDAWTRSELMAMLDACKQFDTYLPNGLHVGKSLEVFIRIGYDTALRHSDIIGLRFDQLKDGHLRLVQQKTGQGILAPLRESTLRAIDESVPPVRERILPWPLRRETFFSYWRRMLMRAGLPYGKREGPQKLRRTSASHLEAAHPGAATAHLGHLTSDMAKRHYVDPVIAAPPRLLPPDFESESANPRKPR